MTEEKSKEILCKDSPRGEHSYLSEDFEDGSWDLYCEYCYEWKDWSINDD